MGIRSIVDRRDTVDFGYNCRFLVRDHHGSGGTFGSINVMTEIGSRLIIGAVHLVPILMTTLLIR